jgi:glycosyltransferase involved in cell wall biosynthesis
MRITHSVSSIESEASGPAYSVPALARALAGLGHEACVMSLGTAGRRQSGGYVDERFPAQFGKHWPLRKLGISPALRDGLRASQADVLHIHGLWMMPNIYPAQIAREQGRPLVLSPRGMLGADALRFSYAVKMLFWSLAQRRAARRVDCFHATSAQEADDIRAFGLCQPIAIIPNGIDLPPRVAAQAISDAPYVLSLGRIHPKKALDRLVLAWAEIEPAFPHWRVKIVGPCEGGYSQKLLRLIGELGLQNVSISGPVFGAEKLELLREAELFVLPTLNENFAMTVAESLAVETPVISTIGAPWAGLVPNECGWWIDHGPAPMAAALREAMSLSPEARRTMGANGRAWMERDFDWRAIAGQMADVYRWLASGGERPECVRVS